MADDVAGMRMMVDCKETELVGLIRQGELNAASRLPRQEMMENDRDRFPIPIYSGERCT